MLSLQHREQRQAWVLLAPMLIVMGLLTAWPLLRTIWLSFTDAELIGSGGQTGYVGLDNYLYALTDPDFLASIGRTLYFTVLSVALEGIIGVLVALLLNQKFRGRSVLRVLVILPWALPTIVNAMMWRLNFNPDYGSINALLTQLHIIDSYRSWLGSPDSALNAVMLADVWKNYPLVTLLVLASMQSIPADLYEAARLDGASAWRRFRAITFPAIVGALSVALILRTIDAFKIFDIIYVMTRGGPVDSTKTLSFYVYQESFSYLRAGSGAAYAILMTLMCSVLIAIYMALLYRQRRRSFADET
ncbi:ABC transporter permease [bacteria symbiont BFo1 of Frankliniella occidentalis]|jgi:multiple sugar transport system permease protein|uniref:carbohydrate ABC transporter permease n=1 Tax=Erwinia aphidicola TaxID=68334 RepID=UPI00066478C7|nr:sugar ABC transporter permease [Erwinia aphidicola]KMV67148.1 ABC transporter permease [bacteria symbiont BFo1 of Frankliniella occidentalis]KYP82958.1 ABC transporter permease [bacteria symbiont BFo1 of Frankliniella occidentalis]KYP87834.1 ABC transporter permease [bacteria symbiont BFo1 of Frankliniella occidentalis]MBD1377716.1 sugar ABC transporter permease [Erwinia aphidicola]CAH0241402.1 Inner membrane ABC transporter permease protein YcjO [Erwinia aphidicola]